jgi:ribulose-phosphate 3-epimerase
MLLLQVDGGISVVTAALCAQAGANILTAGSAIYGSSDYAVAIRALRKELTPYRQ